MHSQSCPAGTTWPSHPQSVQGYTEKAGYQEPTPQEHPHNKGVVHGITSYPAHPPADGAMYNAAPPDAPNLQVQSPQVQPPPAQSHGQALAPQTHSRGATPSNACLPNPSEGARPDPPYLSAHPPPQAHSRGAVPDPIPSTAERPTQNNGPTSTNPLYPQNLCGFSCTGSWCYPPCSCRALSRTIRRANSSWLGCPRWPGLVVAASLELPPRFTYQYILLLHCRL